MTWYLQLNLAIGAFGIFAILLSFLKINSQQKLKAHSILIVFAILVLPALQLIPVQDYQFPQRELLYIPMSLATQSALVIHDTLIERSDSQDYNFKYISYFLFSIILCFLLLLTYRTIRTIKQIQGMFLYKHIGNFQILLSDKKISPYSFALLKKAYIVLPQFLLNDIEKFNLAFQHELQHLKNKDTFWVYMFEIANSVCFLNPILYFWKKQFLLDQEFACDEALIAQKKVSLRAYATCLLQVADTTNSHDIPFGTNGMSWGQMKPQLLRRIVNMKYIKKETKLISNAIISFSVILFTLSVFALQIPANKLTDKLTINKLEKMYDFSDFNSFPIELNEHVLAELNHFLSSNKWRKFTKKSIKKYEIYKSLIDKSAAKYHLPNEIAAIAFIESGFTNLPDRSNSISSKGAGVWQFIPATARNYGLKINNVTDERLNVPKATDAAMRYLSDNRNKFEDLRLSIMSYYVGEVRVQNDIDSFGTRDPWVLIENGDYKTPYLARAMAAAILLKYPSLLN